MRYFLHDIIEEYYPLESDVEVTLINSSWLYLGYCEELI